MPSLRILTSRSARTLAGVLFVIGAATLPGETLSTADHTPPAIATAATPRAPDAEFPLQVSVGLCEDYPEETRTVEAAEADLKRVRNAGGKVLRIAFGWDAMEPKRGEFDWSFW
ncbi:MAG TPA: beta-galactosidase, partial [Opitutaceae bacterium]